MYSRSPRASPPVLVVLTLRHRLDPGVQGRCLELQAVAVAFHTGTLDADHADFDLGPLVPHTGFPQEFVVQAVAESHMLHIEQADLVVNISKCCTVLVDG